MCLSKLVPPKLQLQLYSLVPCFLAYKVVGSLVCISIVMSNINICLYYVCVLAFFVLEMGQTTRHFLVLIL